MPFTMVQFTVRFTLLFLLLPLFQPELLARETAERRMAIDVGASAVKYTIADVNVEDDTIIEILDSDSLQLLLHDDIYSSHNRAFSKPMMNEAQTIFMELKKKAEYYHVEKTRAIATETFRTSHNRSKMVSLLLRESGIKVNTISEEEEDRLDFFTAIRASQQPGMPVVWDIGGSSYQLIVQNAHQETITAKGGYGSTSFFNYILEVAQNKDHRKSRYIHPITRAEYNQSMKFAQHMARRAPDDIRTNIKKNHGRVIAIGSLFQFSLMEAIPDSRKTRHISQQALKSYIEHSLNRELVENHPEDHPTHGHKGFSHLNLSNAILAYGFMVELDIKQLSVVERTSTESILEFTPYWQ